MDIQSIWFFLWGLLWAIYFMTDGFDLGIGFLLPFLGRTDTDRRVMIHAMGPLWDGNEVWLLTAGGVTFAAFPLVYAVMFSSLYSALMLVLFALILRGVSFELRHQVEDPRWRRLWEACTFIGSAVPAVLFGVAFANIFQGIPIDGQGVYHGTLFTLLNPYGLLGGLLFLLLFLQHGALWLAVRTRGDLQGRAVRTAAGLWPVLLAVAVIFLLASYFATRLYDNYLAAPGLFAVVALTVAALLGSRWYLHRQAYLQAWGASALTIVGATFFGIIGLYPNLLPSSLDPAASLSLRNASSSPLTLNIMLVVAMVFVPIVIAYQTWAYHLFRGPVRPADLAQEDAY
jgi:cytochrome d ubiquinol oxidase subunit II